MKRTIQLIASAAFAVGILAWWSAAATDPDAGPATVFIVRHAEKAPEPKGDPKLSEAGKERAEMLAQMLRATKLTRVYSTQFTRTLDTVRPTAKAHNLEIRSYDPRNHRRLVEDIGATPNADGAILVVGHSNTVPELMRALDVPPQMIPRLTDQDYDNLFVVFRGPDGFTVAQTLKFGRVAEAPRGGN